MSSDSSDPSTDIAATASPATLPGTSAAAQALSTSPPSAAAASPKQPLERPGYNLDLDCWDEDEGTFPAISTTMSDSSGISEWAANSVTLRERALMWFVNRISDKSDWERKIFDETIVGNWKAELDTFADAGLPPFVAGFSEDMYEFALQELREKAELYKKFGIVSVLDGAAAVFKADGRVPAELKAALRAGVRPLEDVPAEHKDWHPSSDDKVLDLVHPSLFPLVYGRSRILADRQLTRETCLDAYGAGTTLEIPILGNPGYSDQFQWLPCEVSFASGKAEITSYINNLHPVAHAELYGVIEKVIDAAMPLLAATVDRVMTWQKLRSEDFPDGQFVLTRIPCDGASPECLVPEICQKSSCPCVEENMPIELEGTMRTWEWLKQTHPVEQPEPCEYKYLGYKDYTLSAPWFEGRNVQIIVKVASIHLTPDKPEYDGGSWHIEGMRNERIVATALYYYDCTNVTESRVAFRTRGNIEDMGRGGFGYEQGDYDSFEEIYGHSTRGEDDDDAIEELGDVLTREDRLIAFPNVYQHCLSPFELADKSQPGHRKLIALFLVDPATPILSTANIPPQDRSWGTFAGGGFPPELAALVANQLDCPFDLATAKELRLDFIEERTVATDSLNKDLEHWVYNFCTH